MFSDASYKFREVVSPRFRRSGFLSVTVADMFHERPGYLSRPFRGSQEKRWATVDKESFAIAKSFTRLPYPSWDRGAFYWPILR